MTEGIIARRTGAGVVFTAFDVTRELRAQGVRCFHDEVRRVVHGLYFAGGMPGYTRALRDVGGPAPAYLYYPIVDGGDVDAAGLDPATLSRLRAPSRMRSYSLPGSRHTLVGQGVAPVRRVDRRGTICVPAWMTRALGMGPGDRAIVRPDPGAGRLGVSDQASVDVAAGAILRAYRVDRHANIRITARAQRDAGLDRPSHFRISRSGAVIVLQPL
jgi:hypothetical protein